MNLELSLDGNLVMYSHGKSQVWESATAGKVISRMELTNEGVLNLKTESGAVIWNEGMMPQNIWTGAAENTLPQGETLNLQHFLRSENNRFVAILKDDLSLVVYMHKEDGSNLEIYNNNMPSSGQNLGSLSVNNQGVAVVFDSTTNKALFTSTTKKTGSTYHLRIQNDGSLVTLDENMKTNWSTGESTFEQEIQANIPSEVAAPFTSEQGYFLRSANKNCMLILNSNGQLIIKDKAGKLYWQTAEAVSGDESNFEMYASLAEDGEFSVYLNKNTQAWVGENSKKDKADNYKMTLTDTCQLEIKGDAGVVIYNPAVMKTQLFTKGANKLMPGKSLNANQCLNDHNNMYAVCMTPMGNMFVSIKMETDGTSKQLYTSNTACDCADACVLRMTDKNFEIYDTVNKKQIKLIHSDSVTDYYIMQVDGNSCLYTNGHSNKWCSNTDMNMNVAPDSNAFPSIMEGPHVWYTGSPILVSPNKNYIVVYQWGGYLVIQHGNKSTGISNIGVQY